VKAGGISLLSAGGLLRQQTERRGEENEIMDAYAHIVTVPSLGQFYAIG